MTPFDLLKLSAATWAICYMVTKTSGPFNVFEWIREHLPLGGLTACIICLSIWVSLALLLIGANIVTDAFAVAGVALWAHAYSSWVHISK
jgi:hypothetical protein